MRSLLDVMDALDTLTGAVSRLEEHLQRLSAEEQAKRDAMQAECKPRLDAIDAAAAEIQAAYSDKAVTALQRAEACFAARERLLNSGAAQRRLERGPELVADVRGFYANSINVPRRLHAKVEALTPDISPEQFTALLGELEVSYVCACGPGILDHMHTDLVELGEIVDWLASGRGGRGKVITIRNPEPPRPRQRHGTMTAYAIWP